MQQEIVELALAFLDRVEIKGHVERQKMNAVVNALVALNQETGEENGTEKPE